MLGRRPPDPLYILRGHGSPISCLSVDDSSHLLCSGTQAGDISLWDLDARRQTLQKSKMHPEGLLQTGFLNDQNIFTHGREGTLQLLSFERGWNVISTYQCGTFTFCKATIADSSSKNLLFVPMEKDSIGLLDVREKAPTSCFPQQKTKGMVMACHGDAYGNCFVAYESGHVCVYDCKTRVCTHELRVFSSPVISLAPSSDFSSFACGSSQKEIAFCKTMEPSFHVIHTPNAGNVSLSIRNDNRLLAVGGKDGKLRLFDYRKRIPLAILPNHHQTVNVVQFTNNHCLVSGGEDRNIMMWTIYQHGNR